MLQSERLLTNTLKIKYMYPRSEMSVVSSTMYNVARVQQYAVVVERPDIQ